jgi:hypothetical protein
MIYLPKTQPAPDCLESQKRLKNGSHDCGNVWKRLNIDFKGKCYLCEEDDKTIAIEHFIPHLGNRDLIFDWNNLFFSCGYCNSLKGTRTNLLNCTVEEHSVETVVKYEIESFPLEKVRIIGLNDTQLVINTVELLNEIYNSQNTANKTVGSGMLRNHLDDEIRFFNFILENYANCMITEKKESLKILICSKLDKSSKFTAFKRWIIKDNPTYFQEFQSYLN